MKKRIKKKARIIQLNSLNKKEYHRLYHIKHREALLQRSRLHYIEHREVALQRRREHAQANPHLNKKAVERWRENNPEKDPRKYRITGKLRNRCLKIWGDKCSICWRKFEERGILKPIFHHISYETPEKVVIICYQCHNLIHSRRAYGHPFLVLGGEQSPEILALSIMSLIDKYLVIEKLPRHRGGNRYNRKTRERYEAKITLKVSSPKKNEARAIDLEEK